jgi:hypothetical protein
LLVDKLMEGKKRADGNVTEMRLTRIKVVDQVAAGRRLDGLGRPGCVSIQTVVLLHIQGLSVQIAWVARDLSERWRHRQDAEKRADRERAGGWAFHGVFSVA